MMDCNRWLKRIAAGGSAASRSKWPRGLAAGLIDAAGLILVDAVVARCRPCRRPPPPRELGVVALPMAELEPPRLFNALAMSSTMAYLIGITSETNSSGIIDVHLVDKLQHPFDVFGVVAKDEDPIAVNRENRVRNFGELLQDGSQFARLDVFQLDDVGDVLADVGQLGGGLVLNAAPSWLACATGTAFTNLSPMLMSAMPLSASTPCNA